MINSSSLALQRLTPDMGAIRIQVAFADTISSLSFQTSESSTGAIFISINTTNNQINEVVRIFLLLSPSGTPSVAPSSLVSLATSRSVIAKTSIAKPTRTPTPLPTGATVQCTDAASCSNDVIKSLTDQGVKPCVDISDSCGNNVDCFTSTDAGASSKCKAAAEYKLVVTKESSKKDQELNVLSNTVTTHSCLYCTLQFLKSNNREFLSVS